MILRSIVLVVGLAGGLAAAQLPAFSQQYVQRLGGAVSALEQVVADFDSSAARLGLTRAEALAQMRGTPFVEARQGDMGRTIARYETLRRDFAAVAGLGPFLRAYHIRHFGDAEIIRGTWGAYRPALSLGFASLVFAAAGFVATVIGVGALARLFRRTGRSDAVSA